MNTEQIKRWYGNKFFGVPAEQVKFFDELTETQIKDVRRHFTAALVDVDKYIYCISRDGELWSTRERLSLPTQRGW